MRQMCTLREDKWHNPTLCRCHDGLAVDLCAQAEKHGESDAAADSKVESSKVVERTFSWFEGFRRLSKEDYEFLPESSEAMIELAMSRLMLRGL